MPADVHRLAEAALTLTVLPTTVVGSYSVPEWLERLKTDYYRNRISRTHLSEIHDMAIKAALKDQETAGIDIVSDGELRRDNDIILEFARKGYDDLQVIQRFGWDRALGLGVVDVKTEQIESADVIAQRIRRALDTFPADKLIINPACGLRHLPADVARLKLAAMVEATVAVRRNLPGEHSVVSTEHPVTSTEENLGASAEPTVEQGA